MSAPILPCFPMASLREPPQHGARQGSVAGDSRAVAAIPLPASPARGSLRCWRGRGRCPGLGEASEACGTLLSAAAGPGAGWGGLGEARCRSRAGQGVPGGSPWGRGSRALPGAAPCCWAGGRGLGQGSGSMETGLEEGPGPGLGVGGAAVAWAGREARWELQSLSPCPRACWELQSLR